jgi:hypothetical protein
MPPRPPSGAVWAFFYVFALSARPSANFDRRGTNSVRFVPKADLAAPEGVWRTLSSNATSFLPV